MPDTVKLDPEKTWFKSTTLWGALGLTITGTLIYARLDYRQSQMTDALAVLQKTIEKESSVREKGFGEIVVNVREMRDELRKLVSENVSLRQGHSWVELYQLTLNAWIDKLRADNPNLHVPDLKVPDVPK